MTRLLLCAVVFGFFVCLALAADKAEPPSVLPPVAQGTIDFTRDIKPIFEARCERCHGTKKQEGGLRLDRKASAVSGGNSGKAFQAGKSADSRLVRYVARLEKDFVMPPTGKPLTGEQVGLLRAWIDQGAKWPDEPGLATEGEKSKHWAFQAIKRPLPPTTTFKGWARNPIDQFILARLEKEKLQPSPEADRVTLLRRLSLDLIGLPPTVAEVDAFVADQRPDAYERVVDRLLSSPHYGERWGRHWLDAARYADSDGYNGDAARPIWKYRDWVIDAVTKDKPFDQFVIEQLAGDLLPEATVEQRIATGFHRNTLFNAEGGNDPEEFRVERVVDRVATTGSVFLGLAVGCAECHDHKFDPISQREFYELFAFFNNAEETTLEVPTPQELARRDAHRAELAKWQEKLAAHDRSALTWQNRLAPLTTSVLMPLPGLLVNLYRLSDPGRQQLVTQLTQLKKNEPSATRTLTLGAPTKTRHTHIHIRGNFRRPGAVVTPNVPRVLPALPGRPDNGYSRLDLARWLVAPENPLTARVTVNRLWQAYFGLGLVETENDFGKQGSPPTHPELLDWLAREFMTPADDKTAKWSLKHVHRLIVCSATYRQSSRGRRDLDAVDSRNQLLARQSRLRLEAEIVRDVALSAAGLLATKIGGPSVFPYQPPGVMETRRSPMPWVLSAGADRFRRGMYTHFWRVSPHPFLVTFDAPKSDSSCTRRHRSNTPLQALILLNDPMFLEAARGLAARVLKEVPGADADRVRHAFRLCLGRQPSAGEQRTLNEFLAQQRAEFEADPKAAKQLTGTKTVDTQLAAWTAVARVLLNLDETITRE
jgi:Protein of unknown function (DUF1549)/Protein of unknown function (DUF1553)/Planctomycete cytochrome C